MKTKLFVPIAAVILLGGVFVIPEFLVGDDEDQERVAQRQDEEARIDEINAQRKEIIRKVYQLKRELKELRESGNEDAARRVAGQIEEYTHVLEELAVDRDRGHDEERAEKEHHERERHEENEIDEVRREIERLKRIHNELREAGKEEGAREVAEQIDELVHYLREHEEHVERKEHEEDGERRRVLSDPEQAERYLHKLRQQYEELVEAGKEDAAHNVGLRIRRLEEHLHALAKHDDEEHEERHNDERANDIEREILKLKHRYEDLVAAGKKEEAQQVANHIEELLHHYRESQEERRHVEREHEHEHDERQHHERFEARRNEMIAKLEELHEVREKIRREGNEDELREVEAHIEDLAKHLHQMEEEFHAAHEHEDGHEGRPNREQIEHVVQAIEHLRAAGLHDHAEALERELHAHIDGHDGHHDDDHDRHHGHDDDEHHGHDGHVEEIHHAIVDTHRRLDELEEHVERVTRHLDEVTEFVKKLAEHVK